MLVIIIVNDDNDDMMKYYTVRTYKTVTNHIRSAFIIIIIMPLF